MKRLTQEEAVSLYKRFGKRQFVAELEKRGYVWMDAAVFACEIEAEIKNVGFKKSKRSKRG